MALNTAALSNNPVIVALRVAVYWLDTSRTSGKYADFDLRLAERASINALRYANAARDNASKRVAMLYLNSIRARRRAIA